MSRKSEVLTLVLVVASILPALGVCMTRQPPIATKNQDLQDLQDLQETPADWARNKELIDRILRNEVIQTGRNSFYINEF